MKIYLIGFMGTGKTYLGKKIAKKLNIPFFDLDREIEKKTNLSINKIFENWGNQKFRVIESELLMNNSFDGIIATGGGIVDRTVNQNYLMKEKNIIVWIINSWKLIFDRIANSNRPLVKQLNKQELFNLFKTREIEYSRISDMQITNEETNNTSKIIRKIKNGMARKNL